MDILNAKDAAAYVRCQPSASYRRIAAEGAEMCAAISLRQGHQSSAAGYRAAACVLRDSLAA